jgi:hypothetical protein
MQSEICHQYFGTETGRREKEKETLYGCFKGEELIWPAGVDVKDHWELALYTKK